MCVWGFLDFDLNKKIRIMELNLTTKNTYAKCKKQLLNSLKKAEETVQFYLVFLFI